MIKSPTFILVLLIAWGSTMAQSPAWKRAERMSLGMNLSYLDNWWLGAKEKHYLDFVKPEEAAKRERMLTEIAKAGFKTVRIPINFGAWASLETPYIWENPRELKTVDLFVKWALTNGLNVIIDLHHVEFDGKIKGAAATERIVWLWQEIAERYRNTDPERVFFELRNEPHDISAEDWRMQADRIIEAVRRIAPYHTLIVGFHDWNSRSALIASKPFTDKNIIYTFHYYDPFIFTHQGATWAGDGLAELINIPFPGSGTQIKIPETARLGWIENQIKNYEKDSSTEKMFADLRAVKDWAEKNHVPLFLGEFGSYNKFSTLEDRCRHAMVVYSALGRLNIPNAWWEWDGGFNMFDEGTTKISGCMRKAIDSYKSQRSLK